MVWLAAWYVTVGQLWNLRCTERSPPSIVGTDGVWAIRAHPASGSVDTRQRAHLALHGASSLPLSAASQSPRRECDGVFIDFHRSIEHHCSGSRRAYLYNASQPRFQHRQ